MEKEPAQILATGPGATAPAAPRMRTMSRGGGGQKAQGPTVARGNAILRLEPPGQWELNEGPRGSKKFQGRGGEQRPTAQARRCATARPTPRAQAQ